MQGDTYDQSEFETALAARENLTGEGHIDAWSFFDFKPVFRLPEHVQNGAVAPSWVPFFSRRRLRAYAMLDSFYKLCARRWLSQEASVQMDRREYGDPFLLVEAVASSVLGDDPKIVVEGLLEDDEAATTSFAKACQDQMDKWAKKESFFIKRKDHERNCQKLGDGIIVLGWDVKKKRPRIRVYEPDMFFPVVDPVSDDDFPRKLHVAYEYEEINDQGQKERWVRRITWELRDATPYSVPWSSEKADETCFYKDMKWLLGTNIAMGQLDNLSDDNAVENQADIDLGIDFIPVIHYPNMAPQGEWGVATIAPVIQLLDDLVATDTDLQNSSQLTGSPVLGLGGAQAPKNADGTVSSYGPGTVYETGDGKLDYLDTSHSLDALLKFDKELLERMSVNARTPATLLGRVDPGKVQAGVILTLSMAPHTTMITEMRMLRDVKDSLVLKFVLRMYIKEGILKPGDSDIPEVCLKPGSFLPADKMELANILGVLLPAKGISLETAIALCMTAGYPIDDIQQEIKRIEKRDFAGADDLVTATNDTQAARDYLQLGAAPTGTTEVEQAALGAQPKPGEPGPAPGTKPTGNPAAGANPSKPQA